ncbi:hypothetical protein [Paramuribaculum intestinale]|uniref:hypothetical protein n=1 Tax=Paramuribaculum intestinale TaxID=2094151 RepID=UPI0025A99BE3|nr:hypothetical protein [Paramuribaculum intestinale]
MIRFTITILTLAAASVTATASTAPDTLKTVENPTEVTIVTGGSRSLSLTVKSDSSRYDFLAENTPEKSEPTIDISFPFIDNVRKQHTKGRRTKWRSFAMRGIYAGASMPSDAVPGLRTGWELGISQLSGVELLSPSRRTSLTAGVGYFYRRQKIGNGHHLSDNGYGRLVMTPDAEATHSYGSSISSFGLQLPIMLKQQLIGPTGISVGAVGMWNTYTTASTKWTDADGTTCKRKMKGLHQRAFTVDALLIFNFGSEIGWYARYSPMHLFHHSTGPEYSLWSTGVNIGF